MVIHHDEVDGKNLNEDYLIKFIDFVLVIVVVRKVVDQVLVVIVRIVVHIHVLDRRVHLDQKIDEHDQNLVVIDKTTLMVQSSFLVCFCFSSIFSILDNWLNNSSIIQYNQGNDHEIFFLILDFCPKLMFSFFSFFELKNL